MNEHCPCKETGTTYALYIHVYYIQLCVIPFFNTNFLLINTLGLFNFDLGRQSPNVLIPLKIPINNPNNIVAVPVTEIFKKSHHKIPISCVSSLSIWYFIVHLHVVIVAIDPVYVYYVYMLKMSFSFKFLFDVAVVWIERTVSLSYASQYKESLCVFLFFLFVFFHFDATSECVKCHLMGQLNIWKPL